MLPHFRSRAARLCLFFLPGNHLTCFHLAKLDGPTEYSEA